MVLAECTLGDAVSVQALAVGPQTFLGLLTLDGFKVLGMPMQTVVCSGPN